MVQQVTGAQLKQASVQTLPVQQASTGKTFQSLMKSASGIANKVFGTAEKSGNVKNIRENPEDAPQKKETGQASLSVLSLLGQNISTIQPIFSNAQTAGDTQAGANVDPIGIAQDSAQSINLWQSISNAANVINTSFAQENAENAFGAAQTVNPFQNTGNVQAANDLTAQPENLPQGTNSTQTARFSPLDTAQPIQVSGQNIPDPGKTVNSTDTPLQAIVSGIPGQPAQQDPGSILSVSAEQTNGVVFESSAQGGTARTELPKTEVISAEPKVAAKNEGRSDFAAKLQDIAFSEKKSDLSDTETASQNQGYTQLLPTENVVIPITTNPENTAKSACNQVTDKIETNYRAGKSEFEIDLYPKDLGKVSVKLKTDNGVLTVEITAANPKTQSMLLANTDEIKSILQSAVDQTVQIAQPQERAWYEQSQNQSNQSSAQQQEQQRREHEERLFNLAQDDAGTEDFLSVMQYLSSM